MGQHRGCAARWNAASPVSFPEFLAGPKSDKSDRRREHVQLGFLGTPPLEVAHHLPTRHTMLQCPYPLWQGQVVRFRLMLERKARLGTYAAVGQGHLASAAYNFPMRA